MMFALADNAFCERALYPVGIIAPWNVRVEFLFYLIVPENGVCVGISIAKWYIAVVFEILKMPPELSADEYIKV